MNKRTKKKVKKIAKKASKKIIKSAKKNPKKFAISVFIILLISAIVIGYLYFFGPLKNFLPNNSESSLNSSNSSSSNTSSNSSSSVNTNQNSSSQSSISSSQSTDEGPYTNFISVMESYEPDTNVASDPDNGGLTTTDIDEITSTINSYYASVDNSYKGEALWTTLYTLTEPEELVSYGELRYIEKGNPYADQSPADDSKMIDFYTGIHYPSEWAGGKTWQREHVWCTSHSWWGEAPSESKRHGGTDLHHLRPEIGVINGSRNNSKYGEVNNREASAKYYDIETNSTKATSETGVLYGYLDGEAIDVGVFEPTDRVKGDVARIIMYLLVRYKGETTPVTNIIHTDEGTAEAAYELLLKWHEQDPVSNFEIRRNHRTYLIQGNRNPFIDIPNYAPAIFSNL